MSDDKAALFVNRVLKKCLLASIRELKSQVNNAEYRLLVLTAIIMVKRPLRIPNVQPMNLIYTLWVCSICYANSKYYYKLNK